jgi:hypothetical protein
MRRPSVNGELSIRHMPGKRSRWSGLSPSFGYPASGGVGRLSDSLARARAFPGGRGRTRPARTDPEPTVPPRPPASPGRPAGPLSPET